jgi:hypothetical protein
MIAALAAAPHTWNWDTFWAAVGALAAVLAILTAIFAGWYKWIRQSRAEEVQHQVEVAFDARVTPAITSAAAGLSTALNTMTSTLNAMSTRLNDNESNIAYLRGIHDAKQGVRNG